MTTSIITVNTNIISFNIATYIDVFGLKIVIYRCANRTTSNETTSTSTSKNTSKNTRPKWRPCDSKEIAYEFAKDFVRYNLIAPRTAKFARISSLKAERVDVKTWKLYSYVDSQNSFGAMIRTHYYIKIMWLGGDSWKVLDSKFK